MAHVNLMIDTIIANLPEEGLRSVLRSMLAADPTITPTFEDRTRVYLEKSSSMDVEEKFFKSGKNHAEQTAEFHSAQQRLRCMLGCGMCYESIPLLTAIVQQASSLQQLPSCLEQALSAVDGDIVQAITAIQKTLLMPSGTRSLTGLEKTPILRLEKALCQCQDVCIASHQPFPFERGLTALQASSLSSEDSNASSPVNGTHLIHLISVPPLPASVETFQLGDRSLPRLFSGLWQLSSPSWGTTSTHKIKKQFQRYAAQGFTAFDMADHYGDAEVIFGKFRASCSQPEAVFGATKWCIFTPTQVTSELVQANVSERCGRMSSDHVDLLQFHWQFYNDPQYIKALKLLQGDQRVHKLGLCNFDTQRMAEIAEADVKIYTNQVQFSLVDSRPAYKMGDICMKHNIKLLTYGTLLGGFIAEKWLDSPEPELFSNDITPSQRKYYEMILNWGSWSLFQELLRVLKTIADKHSVSITNVATRWVLDFPYVGAVIVGTRWGVSDNAEDNLKTYGLKLDDTDRAMIEEVQTRTRRDQLIDLLGDCGGEYR
ncbi:uncharacterized protein MYCFIDRAFT_204250 [Pseudocercospora fijiensis CIRAD86]|uniref:NADP-dependent oxidoreductase domain-containing protein n=1 Tax=Pseudocercospora fijiensis (strain CIRAD86) TaxID=383855 RepID=M3AUY2_PSEFD|nr:uncharacterized protein MYCFIDRAFT_204250 [Pseudocercospora fijiensis CIRAD86]EME81277.1 hypothetical protein MYCFIDRAFT_204250 [Pseudocercospora fijiensis CIRAD86]